MIIERFKIFKSGSVCYTSRNLETKQDNEQFIKELNSKFKELR